MKKLLVVLLALCLVFGFSAAAWAADLSLDWLEVDGEDITIKTEMRAEISAGAEEVELELDTVAALDTEVEVDIYCLQDSALPIVYTSTSGTITIDFTDDTDFDDTYKSYSFRIVVKDKADSTKTKSYFLYLDTLQEELLTSLIVNTSASDKTKGVLLGDDFESGEFDYDVYIPEADDVDEVFLWIEPEDDDYTVYVNEKKVKSSKWNGYSVELDPGKNTIEIEVENDDEYALYTVVVERENESNANEALENLYVASDDSTKDSKQYLIYPEFDPDRDTYYVFIPSSSDAADKADLYLRGDLDDDDYFLTINVSGVTGLPSYDNDPPGWDGDWFTALNGILANGGSAVVTLTVYEDSGKDPDEVVGAYTVHIFVGHDEDDAGTDIDDDEDSTLHSLSVRQKTGASSFTKVTLDQKFDEDDTEYTVSMSGNAYGKARIYAEATEEDYAYVLINNKLLTGSYMDFSLVKGANVFTVTVVPPNCDEDETNEYTLTINYDGGAGSLSATASQLKSLVLSDSYGTAITYSPAFDPAKSSYVASVSSATAYINFKCEVEAGSQLFLNGYAQAGSQTGSYLSLNVGNNSIPIQVYAADGAYSTYYVNVYRQPATLKAQVSYQTITVDGQPAAIAAYNVNGNNFVKIRDIAFALRNTAKKFSVGYYLATNVVELTSGGVYVPIGQENLALSAPVSVMASPQSIYLDGRLVTPMAYNIDGNNCVMLRDLGLLLNFYVGYTKATETVSIVTTSSYVSN